MSVMDFSDKYYILGLKVPFYSYFDKISWKSWMDAYFTKCFFYIYLSIFFSDFGNKGFYPHWVSWGMLPICFCSLEEFVLDWNCVFFECFGRVCHKSLSMDLVFPCGNVLTADSVSSIMSQYSCFLLTESVFGELSFPMNLFVPC